MNKFKNTNVIELKYNDFDKIINIKKSKCSAKPGIILFYYEWCGFCQMITPEIIKLAEKKNICVYALNGDKPNSKIIFNHYNINGVPYMLYVSASGKISKKNKYMGNRTVQDMYKFIKKYTKIYGGCGNSVYIKKMIEKKKTGGSCGCKSTGGFGKIVDKKNIKRINNQAPKP